MKRTKDEETDGQKDIKRDRQKIKRTEERQMNNGTENGETDKGK